MKLLTIFCIIDDFCNLYFEWEKKNLIPKVKQRQRSGKLALSEKLTILVFYHLSYYKDFKHYYLFGICNEHRRAFRSLPCYDRFIQIIPSLFLPLCILLHSIKGKQTGIYFMDSTKIKVCDNKRISRNKVFENLAQRGKSSMGWFFGFKLHIVVNHKSEIVAVKITAGNVDDRSVVSELTQNLKGTIYADKGYLSSQLFKELFLKGLRLITNIRSNMKNYLLPLLDKILLRKRFIIETIFDQLKSTMNLEHTRHRSQTNFFINILACLVAYSLKSSKPKLNFGFIHS
jgi:hypothetical protein